MPLCPLSACLPVSLLAAPCRNPLSAFSVRGVTTHVLASNRSTCCTTLLKNIPEICAVAPSLPKILLSSVDVIYTAKGFAVARWLADCCFSSYGSKDRCGKFRSSVSQYSSRSRSLPRSNVTSLTAIYSAGAGVVPKGNFKQRKARSSTIAMHGDSVFACACIQRKLHPGLFFQ